MEKWKYFEKTEYKNGFTIIRIGFEIERNENIITVLELYKTLIDKPKRQGIFKNLEE